MKPFLKHALFVLIAIAFVTCSNGDDTKVSTEPTDGSSDYPEQEAMPMPDPPVESVPSLLPVINRPGYHTIEIKQMKFFPAELSVKEGDTVVWVNNGITAHDVTQQPSGTWTSASIAVGKSWSMIAKENSDYYCSIHVVMTGKIILE